MNKPHYYVGSVVQSFDGGRMRYHQVIEEKDGQQVCISMCPFNPRSRDGWALARKDALMIAEALNKVDVNLEPVAGTTSCL